MPESDEPVKPYRYKGKFESTTTIETVADMDKDALQAYIKTILGADQEKARTSKATSKQTEFS